MWPAYLENTGVHVPTLYFYCKYKLCNSLYIQPLGTQLIFYTRGNIQISFTLKLNQDMRSARNSPCHFSILLGMTILHNVKLPLLIPGSGYSKYWFQFHVTDDVLRWFPDLVALPKQTIHDKNMRELHKYLAGALNMPDIILAAGGMFGIFDHFLP